MNSDWFIPTVTTLPGGRISHVRDTVRHLPASTPPHVVVLHVGTNDLWAEFLDPFLCKFDSLLKSTQEKYPAAKIVVSGLLPRHDFIDLNEKVRVYNIHLAKLCKHFNNCKFVDVSEDVDRRKFFARDGLHLNFEGNERFASVLQSAVESMIVRVIPGAPGKPFIPPELLQLTVKKKAEEVICQSIKFS